MNEFREQYKTDTQKHKINPYLVMKTQQKLKSKNCKKTKFKIKILIPAIIILAISTTTVFAGVGYVMKYGITKNPFFNQHITSNTQGYVQKTAQTDNIKLTVNNVVAENEVAYINFDFETLDGTPLQVGNDAEKSVRQFFDKAYLECDGKQYEIYTFRTDSAQEPNKANFEGQIHNPKEILGKEVTLVLKDFKDEISLTSDIEFTHNSLADILAKGEPEKNFVETGKYIEYADGTSVKSYTLPSGKYKIPFSSKYPNAYIDNFGVKASGESGKECFYISIVPSSTKEKAELEKLIFKNIYTGDNSQSFNIMGHPVSDGKKHEEWYENKAAFNGGRVILALDGLTLNVDGYRNITNNDLKCFILTNNCGYKTQTIQNGSWKIKFTMEHKDTTQTFKINQTIGENKIDSITLSQTNLTIKGSCNYTVDTKGDMYNFKLIMKDGSEIEVGMKCEGWLDEKGIGFLLPTVVDVNNVIGIKMWDTVVNF